MSGQEFKKKVQSTGISLTEISKRLHVSTQLLNAYFKVDDVKTSLLERMCNVLNVNANWFYSGTDYAIEDSMSIPPSLAILEAELKEKNAQIDRLLSIIETLQMQGAKKTDVA